MVWNDRAADKVSLRLRIHAGASFDPQEKEGVMQLLADSFFPTADARDFFRDELGGSLEVVSNYDYIQINASSRPADFVSLIENVSQAISNSDIDKEATASLKAALQQKVGEMEKDPAYVADRAVAKRLFGTFPYGRPALGSVQSIEKIDFADLRFAKDRLLTADNASLAISGNVDPATALRAARRYFGSWLKSDKKAPSTFRQPDPPAKGVFVADSPSANSSELRLAARGVARSDPDYFASVVLQRVLAKRIEKREGAKAFARSSAHVLPGSYVLGVSDWNVGKLRREGGVVAVPVTDMYQEEYLKAPIAPAEFETAHRESLAEFQAANPADLWLDADTFKLPDAANQSSLAAGVRITDVQRVLERLQKEPFAYVLVYAAPSATE
jgi:zinc protease